MHLMPDRLLCQIISVYCTHGVISCRLLGILNIAV